jgi:hypothetical protein
MKRVDDLVQAVTYRFGPDAELQREIARELRAHLEDAVAAARAGGMDEARAEETALRAFGDPEEIGEKLWQANRRRMRLRAVAKWTGRLVLMPAGILLAVWLCAAMVELAGVVLLASELSGSFSFVGPVKAFLPNKLNPELYPPHVAARNGLKEDERLLLEANQFDEGPSQSLERWEKLVYFHPNNPVYRARQYVAFLSSLRASNVDTLAPSDKNFAQAKAILDAGERADPDNAFWNYMKADLLMYKSGAAKQEEDPSFTFTRAAGNPTTTAHGERLVFADRALFERGLDEYRKGLTKPFYKSYAMESQEELLSLEKPPTTLREELSLIARWAAILLPDLACMRNVSRGVMAYAALLIKEGHPEEAETLIRMAPIGGEQVGAASRTLIDLLVANAMRQITLRQGAALYERLGNHGLADRALALARKESQQEGSFLQRIDPNAEEFKFVAARTGFLGDLTFPPFVPLADLSIITDLQRAERFLAERAALGCLALLYLIAVGWLGIRTLWSLWRHRKDTTGPKLHFIGWRRLGWIALIAVALPLAAYAILTRAFAGGSAHYGINYQLLRVALEMGGAMLLIFGLSLFLGQRAATFSCRAAGISDRAELRMSVRRSLLPVLVVCFLLVGIVSQAYLRYGESSAVKALSQPGRRPFLDEMNYVAWKDYKDYLRALPDHGALPADEIRR